MATWFLPFRSLTVTVPTSNKIQKGFLSKKKYGQNRFPPGKSPVSDLIFSEIYSGFFGYYQWRVWSTFQWAKTLNCARQRRRELKYTISRVTCIYESIMSSIENPTWRRRLSFRFFFLRGGGRLTQAKNNPVATLVNSTSTGNRLFALFAYVKTYHRLKVNNQLENL